MFMNRNMRFALVFLCFLASAKRVYALGQHQGQIQTHQQSGWYGQHKAGCTVGAALVCLMACLGWRTYKNWHRSIPAPQPANPLNVFLAQAHHDKAIGQPAPVAAQPNQRHVLFLNNGNLLHEVAVGQVHYHNDLYASFDALLADVQAVAQPLILVNERDALYLFDEHQLEDWIRSGHLTNPETQQNLQNIRYCRLARNNPDDCVVLVTDQDRQISGWERLNVGPAHDSALARAEIRNAHNLWQAGLDDRHRNIMNNAAPPAAHAYRAERQHRNDGRSWWEPRHWLETVAEIGLAILVANAM